MATVRCCCTARSLPKFQARGSVPILAAPTHGLTARLSICLRATSKARTATSEVRAGCPSAAVPYTRLETQTARPTTRTSPASRS